MRGLAVCLVLVAAVDSVCGFVSLRDAFSGGFGRTGQTLTPTTVFEGRLLSQGPQRVMGARGVENVINRPDDSAGFLSEQAASAPSSSLLHSVALQSEGMLQQQQQQEPCVAADVGGGVCPPTRGMSVVEGFTNSGVESGIGVDPATAQALYEDMLLGRVFEDKVAELYFKGRVAGFVHLYNGQEAVSTGVLKAMRQDDYAVSTYRDHVHALSKGVEPREVMAELYGKETGCSKGRGGSMHIFSAKANFVGGFAFIGEQIPIALGIAYSISYRRSLSGRNSTVPTDADSNKLPPLDQHDQVVAVFTGDGSTNNGQFYEALNIAALAKLPIIFIVENNNWAIGMAHYRSTSVPEIMKKGAPFGVPSVEVDGMDVLAVRAAARKAVARAREGLGPTLIEALTYRFRGHSVADPDELRASTEKATLLKRDPITIFAENYMKPNKLSSDYLLKLSRQRVREVVEDAVKFAEESALPCVEEVAHHVFAENYVHPEADGFDTLSAEELKEYAAALRAELEFKKMSKTERRAVPPVYASTKPLKVID